MTAPIGDAAIDAALQLFAPLIAAPTEAALLLDFDGTLSPLVLDPAAARPLPAAVDALRTLAGRFGTVAVVSGRPIEVLSAQLPDPGGIELVGHYGLQRRVGGEIIVDPRVEAHRRDVEAVTAGAEKSLPDVVVERKKGISVGLHWRTAPHMEAATRSFAAEACEQLGLVVIEGRMAVELAPPIDMDKGSAVVTLTVGFRTAAYLGDDVGDVPAFAALRSGAAEGRLDHIVAIAIANDHLPDAVRDATDLVLADPYAVADLLAGLVDATTLR